MAHEHEQSLAFVAEQGKVKHFALQNNAELQDHSKVQSIANLNDAQIVSQNAPNYVAKPDDPIELQKGPAKKTINMESQNEYRGVSYANNANPNDIITNNNNNDDLNGFFGDDNNAENNDDTTGKKPNPYKTMISLGDDVNELNTNEINDDNDDILGGMINDTNEIINDNEIKEDILNDNTDIPIESEEPKKTFLSVWQEQRREFLANKAKEENENKNKLRQDGINTLNEFNDKRALTNDENKKNVKAKEDDLRADFDSVFKHGSIWVQVARLVDLKTKDKSIERMKDLLIALKNESQ